MHELGIAESILKAIRLKSSELAGASITSVGLKVGALSNVVAEALRFAFEAISKDTEFAGVKLDIENCPVLIECLNCGCQCPVVAYNFGCGRCGSGRVKVIQGYELEITYMEIESGDAEKRSPK